MGNCCSDVVGGMAAVGGTAASAASGAGGDNDAAEIFFKSRGFQPLFSQMELSFSATNLRDRDVFSKSDPMLVVYNRGRDGTLAELCRTEVVLNSLNPSWITKCSITYQFEFVQTLLFRVYDVDTQFHNMDVKMLKLEEQQFLGEATCKLSEIITKSARSLTLGLVHGKDSIPLAHSRDLGALIVRGEESISSKTMTEIVIRCSDLKSKDLFSKTDPFLVISKMIETGANIPVCKTEVIKNNLNPIWKPVFLNGQRDSPLLIECFNFNSNGRHDLIGKVQKSLADMEKLHQSREGENLFLPAQVGQSYQNKVLKSKLYVDKFSETAQYTFLDYLNSGFELCFMVAVDFTASNGNPRLPDSLHHIDPSGQPNAYQRAILEIGEVLQFYDTDKRFPAWGFGARPIDGSVSHCFNLNGSRDSDNYEVEGVQGIMMAYISALHNVSLAGPTLFGPVITKAALIASDSFASCAKKYYILLIITCEQQLVSSEEENLYQVILPLIFIEVAVGWCVDRCSRN